MRRQLAYVLHAARGDLPHLARRVGYWLSLWGPPR